MKMENCRMVTGLGYGLVVVLILTSIASIVSGLDLDIEPNSSISQAPYIEVGSYNGTLKITSSSDTTDFYKINVSNYEVLFVNFTDAPIGSDMAITNNYGTTRVSVTDATSANLAFAFSAGPYAGIKITSNSAGGYNFTAEKMPQNDGESGGDAASAYTSSAPLITAGIHSGYLCSDDNNDWYRINVPKNKYIYVNITPNSHLRVDVVLRLYGGTTPRDSDTGIGLGDEVEVCDFTEDAQEYGLGISLQEGYGAYNFTVEFGEQNDAGSGRDAGKEYLDAVWIDNGTYQGQFVGLETEDWYNINLTDGDAITVSCKPGVNSKIKVELHNHISGTSEPLLESAVSEFAGSNVTVHHCFNGASQAQIRVIYSGTYGPRDFYNFTVSTMRQDDAGSGSDAGESGGSAISIDNGSYTAYMEDMDNTDVFKFNVPAGSTINLTASVPTNMNIEVNLRNQSWGIVGSYQFSSGSRSIVFLNDADRQDFYAEFILKTITTEPSTYFYNFVLNITIGDLVPPSASIAALPAESCTNFTVMWSSPDADVKWFDVQVRYGSEAWMDWMVNVTNRTAEYTGVVGVKYFFRVRAMDIWNNWGAYTTNPEGDANTTVTQVCTGSVDNTKPTISIVNPTNGATLSTTEISVQCSATDNVGIAKVEVRVGSGDWISCTLIGGYWSASVTHLQGANNITARATDPDGNYAEVSITVTMSNTPPSAVTLYSTNTKTQTSVKINWTESIDNDFASYQVHVSDVKGFTPSESTLRTTISVKSTNYYTITSLSAGKTYYAKVRVIDLGGLYSDSNELSIKTLSSQQNSFCCGFVILPLILLPWLGIVIYRKKQT
ncbi:MAG: fibronectin type III domain-containing protein [Thermoplasmata archaeon]